MALAIGADDKKKLYILLGLAGVLGVLVMVVINPLGIGKKKTTYDPNAIVRGPEQPTGAPNPGAGTKPGGETASENSAVGKPGAAAAAATPANTTPVQLVSIKSFRSDPFKPFYTPVIQPPPPPPPIPPPLALPGSHDVSLAPATLAAFGGEPATKALVQLPPVNIPHARSKNPTRLGAPHPAGNADEGEAIKSPNKRMAGVIIGDSVRALIVITSGQETITRVVQPGDEVEGMKILKIERITQDDTLVTRMTVLEGGQERYFDLQPAPVANGAGGPGAPTP